MFWKLLFTNIIMRFYLIITFLFLVNSAFCQDKDLFQIAKNGKIGYINQDGEVVIQPKYLEGGEFSEGLASVRLNGKYGFINTRDEITIPPTYDFVETFYRGIVNVYINGEVMFINKKEGRVLPETFNSFRFIDDSTGVFTTKDGKAGLYDFTQNRILVKPKSYQIGKFNNGLAVVTKRRDKRTEYGVMDKRGTFIVEFGRYLTIKEFVDGYALVKMNDPASDDGNIDGAINVKGELLFQRPYKNHSYISEDFHDGLAAVSLYKYWLPEEEGVTYSTSKSYEGFINLKGEVVYGDTLTEYVNDFSNNRAFIQDTNRNYNVIDLNFKTLNTEPFDNVLGNGFVGGYAIVETYEGWGIIDTNLNFIVSPIYENIHEVRITDSLFFFGIDGPDYSELYGINDLKGNTLVSPIIESFDKEGFNNGLLKAVINKKLTYLNRNGDIIWQEKSPEKNQEKNKSSEPVNITYMNRGYFYAYSNPVKDYYNGWGVSRNEPKTLPNESTGMGLVLVEDDFTLFLKNFSSDTVQFAAQDSRLYMKLQAIDREGKWRDIEYLPSSWCGNSYHTIALPPGYYWEFNLPKYQGEFETSIRVELSRFNTTSGKNEIMYSNEFPGSVNPGQFWRKPGYSPNGLMDPYFD